MSPHVPGTLVFSEWFSFYIACGASSYVRSCFRLDAFDVSWFWSLPAFIGLCTVDLKHFASQQPDLLPRSGLNMHRMHQKGYRTFARESGTMVMVLDLPQNQSREHLPVEKAKHEKKRITNLHFSAYDFHRARDATA